MSYRTSQPIVDANGGIIDFSQVSLGTLGAHLLFGPIDTESVRSAVEFIIKANQLMDKREITLFVNTNGGDCYDGFGLIDMMSISRLPVKTVGVGNIVSMGVLILSAGEKGKRIITRNTQVMAHQFAGVNYGKFHELLAQHQSDLYLKHQFVQHFLRCSKMTEKKIEDIVFGPTDRWLTPQECKKLGLVDQVVDELPEFSLDLPPVVRSPSA